MATKAGDERSDAERYCQQIACEWQGCVERWTYKPEKCNDLKKKYKTCIDGFLAAKAAGEPPPPLPPPEPKPAPPPPPPKKESLKELKARKKREAAEKAAQG